MAADSAREAMNPPNGDARQPDVGDMVHFFDENCEKHPAVITRMLRDGRVNLHVLFDGGPPEHRTSVPMKSGYQGRTPMTATTIFGWPQPYAPYSTPGFGPAPDDSGDTKRSW